MEIFLQCENKQENSRRKIKKIVEKRRIRQDEKYLRRKQGVNSILRKRMKSKEERFKRKKFKK
jgi:hypothetical protein